MRASRINDVRRRLDLDAEKKATAANGRDSREPRERVGKLGADRLLFATDVDGVLLEGRYLCAIGADSADLLLATGTFEGGIVPKLVAAVRAARSGVRSEIGVTAVLA